MRGQDCDYCAAKAKQDRERDAYNQACRERQAQQDAGKDAGKGK